MEFSARSKNSYCFKKDDISSSNQSLAEIDADGRFNCLVEEFNNLRETDIYGVEKDLTVSHILN